MADAKRKKGITLFVLIPSSDLVGPHEAGWLSATEILGRLLGVLDRVSGQDREE